MTAGSPGTKLKIPVGTVASYRVKDMEPIALSAAQRDRFKNARVRDVFCVDFLSRIPVQLTSTKGRLKTRADVVREVLSGEHIATIAALLKYHYGGIEELDGLGGAGMALILDVLEYFGFAFRDTPDELEIERVQTRKRSQELADQLGLPLAKT